MQRLNAIRVLLVALLVGFACCWTLAIVSYAWLETAPLPWDEAYLTMLPTRVAQAWSSGGFFEAIVTYYETSIHKPPLSSLGTAIAMIATGQGPLELRLDNIVVALLAALGVQRFLARHTGEVLAAVFAACLLATPFALAYTRTELAEIYVVTCTVALYAFAVPRHAMRTRSSSVVLGLLVGLGITAKLSFGLIAFPVLLWTAVGELATFRTRQTTWRSLLGRASLSLVAAVLVVAVLCHRSWKHMWRHLRNQSTWIGDQYGGSADRFDSTYFENYMRSWLAAFSWLWIAVLVGVVLLGIVDRARRASRVQHEALDGSPTARHTERAPFAQQAMLAFAFIVNLAACYVWPVTDIRFTVGAMVAAILLLGISTAQAVRRDGLRVALGLMMLTGFGSWLLANTYASSPQRTLLTLPWRSGDPGPLHAPLVDADLRDTALDALQATSSRVALAGDHPSFNVDNLRLRILERGLEHEVEQVGYLAPEIGLPEALARLEERRPVDAFFVCRAPQDSEEALWTSRLGGPFFEALSRSEDWGEATRMGGLRDGSEVFLFRRKQRERIK